MCSQRGDAGTCPLFLTSPPDRPWFWTAKLIRKRPVNPPVRGSDVLCVVGRQRRKISGRVTVATCGIRSTPAACARHACTSGPRHNASYVNDGPCIPTGTGNDCRAHRLHRIVVHNLSRRPGRLVGAGERGSRIWIETCRALPGWTGGTPVPPQTVRFSCC